MWESANERYYPTPTPHNNIASYVRKCKWTLLPHPTRPHPTPPHPNEQKKQQKYAAVYQACANYQLLTTNYYLTYYLLPTNY